MTEGARLIPCSDAVKRLWDYLDQALEREDVHRVEEHLAFCRKCCGELEFAKEMRAFLASHAAEEVPEDVRRRLEGFVDEL